MTRARKSQRAELPLPRGGAEVRDSAEATTLTLPTQDHTATWKARSDLALSITSLFGVAVAVLGVVLAFLGSVAHRRWHSVLSIDAGLFPQPFDALVVKGVYAVQEGLPLLPVVLGALRPVAWVVILLGIGPVVAFSLTREWRSLAATWARTLLLVTGVAVLAHFAFWISIATMRAVAETGIDDLVTAAKSIRLIQGTAGGCPEGLSRRFHCVTAWRGDQLVASGIVISASTQRAVILDSAIGAPRVLDLSGLELRGRFP